MDFIARLTPGLMVAALLVGGRAEAVESAHEHHAPQAADKTAQHQPAAKTKGHHFAAHWSATLKEEQKQQVDRLHIEHGRSEKVLKTARLFELAKLNALTAVDHPNPIKIEESIASIAELERALLSARYAHLVEMRTVLTPEQRISYDTELLGRGGVAEALGGH